MTTRQESQEISTDDIIDQFSDVDLVPHGFLDLSLPPYKSTDQLSDLHSKSSKLLSELDHYSQDITWKLETALGELSRSGKRLNYEVEMLKSEVSGLVSDVDEQAAPMVKNLVDKSSPDDADSRLQVLDTVRSRMLEVQKIFEEASRYDENRITNDVVTAINGGHLDVAESQIQHIEKLIEIWKGTSVYDSRVKFVAGLKKRLRAIVDSNSSRGTMSEPTSRLASASPLPDTVKSQTPDNSSEGYYGLINQLQRKIF